MDLLDTQLAAHADIFRGLEVAGMVFIAAVVLETIWDVARGHRSSPRETVANLVIALGGALLERTAFGLIFVIGLALVVPFALADIPQTWWSWLLAIIVADFSYYWMHRCEHQVRILWAHHSVHHSSSEFNFTTALRLAWIEAAFEWVFLIPMILAGFGLVQTLIAFLIVVSCQSWIHTGKVGRLGWLDGVFNTPSVHRVHHGANPAYLDRNYGGILIIWDRLFGTYAREEEKVIFGITNPLNSANPLKINFHEYGQIIRDILRARSLRQALVHIFGPPGAAPAMRDD